ETAEQALAVEQYRQQSIAQAAKPHQAEQRIDKFKRHWASLSTSAFEQIERERAQLETLRIELASEAQRIDEHGQQVAELEAELVAELLEIEDERTGLQDERGRLRREAFLLREQQQHDEAELAA